MQDSEQLELAKKALRHECLARRSAMRNATVAAACRLICTNVSELLAKHANKSGAVFSYLAYGNEVNLAELHRQILHQGRRLAVPRTLGLPPGQMQPMYITEETPLERSKLGVREPVAEAEPCQPQDLAVILLPGVAFDVQGGRLGHGAGYYDRFLNKMTNKPLLVGVAYEWQVVKSVPQGIWDQAVDYLVTEKQVRHFAK